MFRATRSVVVLPAIATTLAATLAVAQAPTKPINPTLVTVFGPETVAIEVVAPDSLQAPLWGAVLASASEMVYEPIPGMEVLFGADVGVVGHGLMANGMYLFEGARPPAGIYYLQGLVLTHDLRVMATEIQRADLRSSVDRRGDPDVIEDPGHTVPAVLDGLRASIEIMESQPPQYAVVAAFQAPSDGYALVPAGFRRFETGVIEAMFVLKVPSPGEGLLDVSQLHSARVPLGYDRGTEVHILAAITDRLGNERELVFHDLGTGPFGL